MDLHTGNCIDVMRGMADASVDAIVTDPPYELGFMGKSWDSTGIANNVGMWAEALRVLKPGGHLLAFSGSRTYHRMTCAIEDAGFDVRDQIMWVYGSGFPKSLDVSKAIDKARTEDREPVRVICRAVRSAMDARTLKSRDLAQHFGQCDPRLIDHWAARDTDSQPSLCTWEQWLMLRVLFAELRPLDAEVWRLNGRKGTPGEAWQSAEVIGEHAGEVAGLGGERFSAVDKTIREPSDAARQWQGWGTALKPAHEPIVVARKPLIGTVAANVLAHGTGALNIDGCRIGEMDGRWPANLIHDGSDEVVSMFPEASGQSGAVTGDEPSSKTNAGYGDFKGRPASQPRSDVGSAARFFYCAKTSSEDRNEGCESLPQKTGGMVSNTSGQHITRRDEGYTPKRQGNFHPTVKPTDLMRYLCRLVTPPGGLVLDPFMGSGSTGKAAVLEGFRFIGIDLDPAHVAIAQARIDYARRQGHQPSLLEAA